MSTQTSLMPDDRERARTFKRPVKKAVEVWYRAKGPSLWFKDWARFGKYKDDATAQQVLRQKSSDPYFEYEIRCLSTSRS